MSKPQRITFNRGETYWHYDTPERLEQIKAFVARESEVRKFSPARCIEATLAEERKLYEDASATAGETTRP